MQHQHWKDVCLTTFNEDDCVLNVCVFQFCSRQFARLLAEEILSYSSAAMCVALVQSYLTIMSYSLWHGLTRLFVSLHFGSSKIYICGFNHQMHLHMSSFIWNAAQTTSWSGSCDRIYITKRIKWLGVNNPYIFFFMLFFINMKLSSTVVPNHVPGSPPTLHIVIVSLIKHTWFRLSAH